MQLLKEFTKYVSLNVLGMIGLSCYILADTFFVANGIGINGLTALNLSISIYSVIHGTGLLIGIGSASQFAINKGSNENTIKNNQIFSNAIMLSILISLVFIFIGVFLTPALASLLGANIDTLEMTSTYLKTILCFSPFFILNNVGIAFVRNDNNPTLAMIAMLIGSLSNIILDYYFIFDLDMGIFGAALATGLAPIISLCILSLHLFKKQNTFHLIKSKLHVETIKHIIQFGNASFIMEISSSVILIIFNLLLLNLGGNIAVAAYGIIANIALVATSVFTGIGQGIQPLVSQYYASQKKKELFTTLRYALFSSLTIATIIYGIIFFNSQILISAFNNENNQTLYSIASTGLQMYFVGFFFAGINISMTSFFSATALTKQAFVTSICRTGGLLIPFAFILSSIFGIQGLWLSFVCSELGTLLFVIYLTKRNRDFLSLTI